MLEVAVEIPPVRQARISHHVQTPQHFGMSHLHQTSGAESEAAAIERMHEFAKSLNDAVDAVHKRDHLRQQRKEARRNEQAMLRTRSKTKQEGRHQTLAKALHSSKLLLAGTVVLNMGIVASLIFCMRRLRPWGVCQKVEKV